MGFGSIRRSQLVAPFGVGAMFVTRSGVSVMCCSLDKWYKRELGDEGKIDIDEFIIREWRLERELAVEHFRLPPDYRAGRKGDKTALPNMNLTVPFLRFPRFHYCTSCGYLTELTLSDARKKVLCPSCETKGKKRLLVQVPIIAICEHGHIQDFPWREWVHKSASPKCERQMYLKGTGGASLASQVVKCECGAQRNLAQVTDADPNNGQTHLSMQLEPGGQYLCKGKRPWMHDNEGVGCGKPLRGSLRSASNVYFASIKSSIYLPQMVTLIPDGLLEIFQKPRVSGLINHLIKGPRANELNPDFFRVVLGHELDDYTDDQIETCLQFIINGNSEEKVEKGIVDQDPEAAFRREEFEVLSQNWDDNNLKVEPQELSGYGEEVLDYFANISLVKKLRETRVLTGFTRVLPENDLTTAEKMNLLWSEMPSQKWLPAYVVHGEGIFFGFDESKLAEWEKREEVQDRIKSLIDNVEKLAVSRRYILKEITPRFVLLHTFAHVLINRLTFDCGYSTASLRERLYISCNPVAPMAGVLIYTAAGDSEGTMGGLVRMGRPGHLEPVLRRTLEAAKWCSADPVCMEMGDRGGQGPDSCNLAACHSCALVPETACEEFNRFLDRALLVGSLSKPNLGFFV